MKPAVKYSLASILLLAATAVLSVPMVTGPHSLRSIREEQSRLDTEAVRIAELEDSVAAFTALDSLTFANIHTQDE